MQLLIINCKTKKKKSSVVNRILTMFLSPGYSIKISIGRAVKELLIDLRWIRADLKIGILFSIT